MFFGVVVDCDICSVCSVDDDAVDVELEEEVVVSGVGLVIVNKSQEFPAMVLQSSDRVIISEELHYNKPTTSKIHQQSRANKQQNKKNNKLTAAVFK